VYGGECTGNLAFQSRCRGAVAGKANQPAGTYETDAFLLKISVIDDVVACVQEAIDQKLEDAREQEHFVVSLYQMDIERVRYSLARYLRTRILKIERNLEYILSNIDVMDRLSMNEKVFATKLNNINNTYFEENVSNRFQHQDAKEYYDVSDNRLRNAQPSEKVSTTVLCVLCRLQIVASRNSRLPNPMIV
jgi:hypothetical protein